jgi:hypothetical protein
MKDRVGCQEDKVPGWSIGEMEYSKKNGVLEKWSIGVLVITALRSEGPTPGGIRPGPQGWFSWRTLEPNLLPSYSGGPNCGKFVGLLLWWVTQPITPGIPKSGKRAILKGHGSKVRQFFFTASASFQDGLL